MWNLKIYFDNNYQISNLIIHIEIMIIAHNNSYIFYLVDLKFIKNIQKTKFAGTNDALCPNWFLSMPICKIK